MIEVLKDFPDNVAAFACHGHLTKADYETVLIPVIEDKLKRHKKLRSYTEIAPDFARRDRTRRLLGGNEVRIQSPLRLGTQRASHRRGMDETRRENLCLPWLPHPRRDPCVLDRRSRESARMDC